MNIKIYQVNDFFFRDLAFTDYERTVERTGSADMNRDAYNMVWAGELDHDATLAEIFEIFNTRHPEGYRGRSLSVSDIVELPDGLHFCDSFGWKSVKWQADIKN